METKIQITFCSRPRSFGKAVFVGAVLLIASSVQAQNLFVANSGRQSPGSGYITEITPSETQSIFASGLYNADGIVFNSAGDLFEADASSGNVYEFTPGGAKSTFASGLNYPVALAFDSVGNLFVALDSSSNSITKITPGGVKSTFASGLNQPVGLAFSSAGNLFVASEGSGNIYEFTPGGANSTFASGLTAPKGLAFNSAGILFEADSGSGNINEFKTNGTKSTFASGLSEPYGLAFNSAGILFVSDFASGNIYEFTPDYTNGEPLTVFASGLELPDFLTFPAPLLITVQPYGLLVSNLQTASFAVSATGSPPLSYEWLKNAVPLAASSRIVGASTNALTISDATVSDAGLYSVIITNYFGAITSTPAMLAIDIPDKTVPTVKITSPLQNEKLITNAVTLAGTAKSGVGLAAAWYQLNAGGWLPATTADNWSNWTASVALSPYTNTIQACAADAAGKLSTIRDANVTYVVSASLSVTTNGNGTIKPNSNDQSLQIGKTYSLTAKPETGYVFSSWTMAANGNVFSNSASPVLTFVMQSGLQLTANFVSNPQPLEVTFTVSKTSVVESGTFTAQVTASNTSGGQLDGVYVDGEALSLDDGGNGFAVPLKFISPVITSLGPGKSVTFRQQFKATTSGTFRLYCVVDSSAGSSGTSYSPYITVYPSKIGVQPKTDSSGNAQVVAGNISLPVNLYDEETGSSLSGFALGLAVDPNHKGQAMLAAVDTAGRYPTQFFILQGPSGPTESSFRKTAEKQVIVAGGSDAEKSNDSPSVTQPVSIPIDQPCGGNGPFAHMMVPIETPALPIFEPPAPDSSAPDPASALLAEALQSAQHLGASLVTRTTIPCENTVSELAKEIGVEVAEDQASPNVILGVERSKSLAKLFPRLTGMLEFYGSAGQMTTAMNGFADAITCYNSDPRSPGVWKYVILNPYFLSFNVPASSAGPIPFDPNQFVHVVVTAVDQYGIPLATGSIEMVSANNLGSGVRAVIPDGGTADLPVLINDSGTMCVRSPGRITQSVTWSSTTTSVAISVTMPPQQIVSGTLTSPLGQPTGFLPEGTSVQLTAHFYDANGTEITNACQPQFIAYNPVGSAVAKVDIDTGVVTILGGCGAAIVIAYCCGVETAPKLISSDCNGSQPPVAFSSFAINPSSLSFSATEGGGNPGSQNVYIVTLKSGTLNYSATPNQSWINVSTGNGSATIGVDIAGLAAGTYTGAVEFVDTDAPQNHEEVKVTLIIKSKQTTGSGGTSLVIAPDGFLTSLDGCYDTSTGIGTITDPQPLIASGGSPVGGYTWKLASGSTFPPGTTVDPQTGVFQSNGQNVLAGNYQFTITASDGVRKASSTFGFTVTTGDSANFDPCPTAILQTFTSTYTLPAATAGKAYGVSLWVVGGTPPYSWSVASGSNLPDGLQLDPNRGVLWGTPNTSAAGQTFTFSITTVDSEAPSSTTTATYNLTVNQ